MTVKNVTLGDPLAAISSLEPTPMEVEGVEALGGARAPDPSPPTEAADGVAAASATANDPVDAIAHALSAGAIPGERAVELLVERALGDTGGISLTSIERAEMRAHIADLLTDDPYLSGLCARLGHRPATDEGSLP